MGATEEQMALLSAAHVSHVSYILILYSISFLLFLFVSMLLHLYAVHVWPIDRKKSAKPVIKLNGSASAEGGKLRAANGHVERRVRDAEEFELEGLISEGESEAGEGTGKKIRGVV